MRRLLSRWWLWAGALFLLVVLLASYLLIPVGQSQINQASCDKIQIGWTVEQVGELLGERRSLDPTEDVSATSWHDEDGNRIVVRFARERGVIAKRFEPSEFSWLERAERRVLRRIPAW